MMKRIFSIFVMALLAGCLPATQALTATSVPPTSIATAIVTTAVPAVTTEATFTAEATVTIVPQATPTASPQSSVLKDCPPSDPVPFHPPAGVVMVSEEQAWYWDEKESQLLSYPLPDPDGGKWRQIEISADGRFVAYQMPAADPPPTSRPPLYSSAAGQRDQELWLLDLQSGQSRQIAGPPPDETVRRYPDETEFSYEARWVDGSHLLGFASHPANGETPTYEAYHLLDADTNRTWTLLPGGEVGAVIFRPDEAQAAAIATSGVWNDTQGELRLIEVASGKVERSIPLELKYSGRWQRLSYAPDGRHVAVMVSSGIAVIDTATGEMQNVPLEFNCQGPGSGFCSLPEPVWAEDGQSFTVWVEREPPAGSTVPIQVTQYMVSWSANGNLTIQAGITINTGWGPRSLSPDGQFLLFASPEEQLQPGGKPDTIITFIQPLQGGEPVRYLEAKNTYPGRWSPDSRRFLITETRYSTNIKTLSLAVGHVCEQPTVLPLPETGWLSSAIWMDADSFLALFGEETEEPTQWQYTLYRYDLNDRDFLKLASFTASSTSLSMFPINEE